MDESKVRGSKKLLRLIIWLATGLVLIVALVLVFFLVIIPHHQAKVTEYRSSLAVKAIEDIMQDLKDYNDAHGSLEGYAPESRIRELVTDGETNQYWDFRVVMWTPEEFENYREYQEFVWKYKKPHDQPVELIPYRQVIATATTASGRLAGKHVWFDVKGYDNDLWHKLADYSGEPSPQYTTPWNADLYYRDLARATGEEWKEPVNPYTQQ